MYIPMFQTVLQLEFNGKSIVLSVGGFLPSLSGDVLGINPLFAAALDISEKQEVHIRSYNNVPRIQRVIISPLQTCDYDILVCTLSFNVLDITKI